MVVARLENYIDISDFRYQTMTLEPASFQTLSILAEFAEEPELEVGLPMGHAYSKKSGILTCHLSTLRHGV